MDKDKNGGIGATASVPYSQDRNFEPRTPTGCGQRLNCSGKGRADGVSDSD